MSEVYLLAIQWQTFTLWISFFYYAILISAVKNYKYFPRTCWRRFHGSSWRPQWRPFIRNYFTIWCNQERYKRRPCGGSTYSCLYYHPYNIYDILRPWIKSRLFFCYFFYLENTRLSCSVVDNWRLHPARKARVLTQSRTILINEIVLRITKN